MTNYDFFKAFAADVSQSKASAYYFEHDAIENAGMNLKSAARTSTQIMMFHFTVNARPNRNQFGKVVSMRYLGEVLFLLPSDARKTIGTQRATSEANSRYYDNVRDMLDDGGISDELYKYECYVNDVARNDTSAYHAYTLEIERIQEVYGVGAFHGDGINVVYNLTVEFTQSGS